ncbi:unnamed protein product [Tetraodon nigroviridis]|uniref:(spotted green pufferfish) hypothetical protein n=1 Tax=Tetraodon nigroviridis TaxID=99883 RepID=Q4S6D8_TETNG|nr:unnamed protein product [Tetraodon nigroviridis]
MVRPGQEEGRVQPTQRETRYHGKDKLEGSQFSGEPRGFRAWCSALRCFKSVSGNLRMEDPVGGSRPVPDDLTKKQKRQKSRGRKKDDATVRRFGSPEQMVHNSPGGTFVTGQQLREPPTKSSPVRALLREQKAKCEVSRSSFS